ncbi:hypothetical protein IV203_005953 [Nitzschia inconspicua]|uniref:Uncharacterized protein n=1 Tax=Nitzschia inconspicua TaxID=303405 RepID=A0A9K3KPB4_9STRA|nr:hypothetical protein IV203_005953 [Nitzschia inconspicua]
MREMDQLIASVAQVTADQEREEIERKEEVTAAKAKERKKTQAEVTAAETKKRDEPKPALEAIMANFVSAEKAAPACFEEMPKIQLVNILKYFYDEKPRGLCHNGQEQACCPCYGVLRSISQCQTDVEKPEIESGTSCMLSTRSAN